MTIRPSVILGFLLAVLVSLGALGFLWSGERSSRLGAEALVEASAIREAGLALKLKATRAELAQRVQSMIDANPALGAEVAKVKRAVPSAKPVEAVTASTGPIVAHGTPRPAGAPLDGPTAGPGAEPPASATLKPGAPCLLAEGDGAELRNAQLTLRSDLGNGVVVGTAEGWRLSPGEPALILAGVFSTPLTNAVELKLPDPLGMAVGLGAACSRPGCSFGPAIGAPPIRLLGGQLEATLAVPFIGAEFSAAANVLYRR